MPIYKDERMLGFKAIKGFEPMDKTEFQEGLERVTHKNTSCARALLILLYYTGCRPIEALLLTRENFRKEGSTLWIVFPGVKGGDTGTLTLPMRNPQVHELASFVLQGWTPGYPVFYPFIGKPRTANRDKTHKVRHLVKKTYGTTSYFLRHNRFSRAAMKGATILQLKELKRAKRENSIYPYLHFSQNAKKKLQRFMAD